MSKFDQSNDLLFKEHLQEFVLDTVFKDHHQVMNYVRLLRVSLILLLIPMCYIALTIEKAGNYGPIIIVIGLIAISIILLESEFFMKKVRVSSVPIRLYSNRILMHSFPYEKLLGYNGCIEKEDVVRVEIIRGRMEQRLAPDNLLIKWENSPVRYNIITRDGKRHSSGLKPPGQVIEITAIIREKWGVPVTDPGDGMGLMTGSCLGE